MNCIAIVMSSFLELKKIYCQLLFFFTVAPCILTHWIFYCSS